MCLFRRCSKYERNYELVSNLCFSLTVVNVSSLLFYLGYTDSNFALYKAYSSGFQSNINSTVQNLWIVNWLSTKPLPLHFPSNVDLSSKRITSTVSLLDTVLTSFLVYLVPAALFAPVLHLCMPCDLNSYYYTNAIFQENQKEPETKFLCKNKGLVLF